ncbi:MAG: hypothetical protein WBA41_11960 [Rivularia sp. (in: cyanobacteria)]
MLEDYLNQLLKTQNNSELARHLHHDLSGLCASLESAVQTSQDNDPGVEICNKLIDELNKLLQKPTPSKNKSFEEDNSDLPTSKFKLKDLREAVLNDKTLRYYLGDSELSTKDSDLWNEIHRLLLRVPEQQAIKWRDLTHKLAQEAGAQADESAVIKLPYKEDKLLYPGLSGTVQAKGLCLSTKAPLNRQVSRGTQDGELKFLSQAVSICLEFIEMDQFLRHCLKGVYDFDITPLDSQEKKSDYAKALINRFERVQESENNPVKSLRARLDLDEAIHSLVYYPLAESDSWWSQLQNEARKTLKAAVEKVNHGGDSATHQWLTGLYKNVTRYTHPAPTGNLAVKDCDTPGKVLVCLRVYAKINGEEILGRVLYCPFQ